MKKIITTLLVVITFLAGTTWAALQRFLCLARARLPSTLAEVAVLGRSDNWITQPEEKAAIARARAERLPTGARHGQTTGPRRDSFRHYDAQVAGLGVRAHSAGSASRAGPRAERELSYTGITRVRTAFTLGRADRGARGGRAAADIAGQRFRGAIAAGAWHRNGGNIG